MNELKLVADTCAALFSAHEHDRDAPLDQSLWAELEGLGFTLISVPEALGGGGGGLDTATMVLAAAAGHAANVPLGETLLAGWLLAEAGLPVPPGPLTAISAAGTVTIAREGAGLRVRGRLPRVGWGRAAGSIVVLGVAHGREAVVMLGPGDVTVRPGRNLAGEPRDDVLVDRCVPAAAVLPAPAGASETFRRRAALVRVVLLAGAMRRSMELTVRYAGERQQFGRPLSGFQAVQQQIAQLAAEATATGAVVDAAMRRCADDGFADPRSWFALAAAKVQAARAAGVVAGIAHQVHGAIGFTEEHPLRLTTTRLWAWRDEAGSQDQWAAELGSRVLAGNEGRLWEMLTETAG